MRCGVVTMGECLVSLVAADSAPFPDVRALHPYVAGAEANVAIGLSRLGQAVAFIGRVGDDGFGTRILRALRGEAVDVRGVTVDADGATGVMIRERRGVGPSEVIYYRASSAGARLSPEDVAAAVDRGTFANARWLHLTGITPALSSSCRAAVMAALEASRAEGMTASLDVNLRRRLWSDAEAAVVLRDLGARVDILIAGEAEASLVTGLGVECGPMALAEAILAMGPSLAVLKLGAGGGFALAQGGSAVRVAALPVGTVIDPIGAGDGFSAGFIAARLEGADIPTALAWANACGAASVAAEGDMAGLPTRTELERLLAGGQYEALR